MNAPVKAIVTHRFTASAERVYDAWLDPHWIGRWMYGPPVRNERIVRLATEPRVGGRYSYVVDRQGLQVDHVGEYLELDRPQLLVFTWGTRASLPDTSRVVVEIAARADGGCDLTLTHVMGTAWADYSDKVAASWRLMLGTLDRTLTENIPATLSSS
jgi:uncharacterized protein YndB with AHSA1/START domain